MDVTLLLPHSKSVALRLNGAGNVTIAEPGKRIKGFQTGDRVKAEVTKIQKISNYIRRVAVRASRSFNIQTAQGVIQGMVFSPKMRTSRTTPALRATPP